MNGVLLALLSTGLVAAGAALAPRVARPAGSRTVAPREPRRERDPDHVDNSVSAFRIRHPKSRNG